MTLMQLCVSILILARVLSAKRINSRDHGLRQTNVHSSDVRLEQDNQDNFANATKGEQHLCAVSSNAAKNKDFAGLIGACMAAEPKTQIVAMGLQDYRGLKGELPDYVDNVANLKGGARFKRRDVMTLGSRAGTGHFCYSKFMSAKSAALLTAASGFAAGWALGPKGAILGGLAGGVGGLLVGHGIDVVKDVGCGGVVVALYSLSNEDVAFDVEEPSTYDVDHRTVDVEVAELERGQDAGKTSPTTFKGSVAMKFQINGRQIIIASTHAQEGVRGKHIKDPRKEFDVMLAAEHQRVLDFRNGLHIIDGLMQNSSGGASIIWMGDFNPRSMDPRTKLADFGEGDAAYARLLANRDILGAAPSGEELTTFTKEIADSGLQLTEIRFPRGTDCPTYMKASSPKDAKGHVQFQCGSMYYKYGKPPSWTDRIFVNRMPWITHSDLNRVAHDEDHDAVFATFVVRSP